LNTPHIKTEALSLRRTVISVCDAEPDQGVEKRVRIGRPASFDGAGVHGLVSRCKPLDENSMYCNLLQCSHFADTSATAYLGEELVGFVSGYIPPKQSDVLFVWQVAVDESMRGHRLGAKMIEEILTRQHCAGVSRIHTTITQDNAASQAMFRSLAKHLKAPANIAPHFDATNHFDGHHNSEFLWNIGPVQRPTR